MFTTNYLYHKFYILFASMYLFDNLEAKLLFSLLYNRKERGERNDTYFYLELIFIQVNTCACVMLKKSDKWKWVNYVNINN